MKDYVFIPLVNPNYPIEWALTQSAQSFIDKVASLWPRDEEEIGIPFAIPEFHSDYRR